jgi:hypothetical protein
LPDVRHARFALWHAVSLAPGPLRVKAYLNPQIRGTDHAARLTAIALRRLGMGASWARVSTKIPRRYLTGDALRYFALDLESSATARVKLYVYLRDATANVLEGVAALGPKYVNGEVAEFCRAMTGRDGPYDLSPICVYLAFTEKSVEPSTITVQIPIRFYVPNDHSARDRIRSYLRLRGIDHGVYDRALESVARRPLSMKSGLHTYVSLRTGRRPPRVTLYFGAELYPQRRASGPRIAVRAPRLSSVRIERKTRIRRS